MSDDIFDRQAENYAVMLDDMVAFSGRRHQFFMEAKADLLIRLLDRLGLTGTAQVLDVGCGVGLIHPMLMDRVHSIDGVDVSDRSIAVASQNNPTPRYTVYDGNRLPYDEGSFDLTYAICVLHHVPPSGWQDFVAEMRRVTRPGGAVVIIEHNPYNPFTRHIVNTCPLDADAVMLTPGTSRALLRKMGIHRPATRHFLFTPFEAGAMRWLEERLGWLPLGAQYMAWGQVPAQ